MDGRKQRKVRNRLKHTGNPKLPGWNKKAIAAVKDNKVVADNRVEELNDILEAMKGE
jgi:hypothetical protein